MYEKIDVQGGVPIKAWVNGVRFEDEARAQVERIATMPFVHDHVAVMPDVHAGIGATVGSVVATRGAIIPAAVGVDIGCGMCALRTSLVASQLPDNLAAMRSAIENHVPAGRTNNGGAGDRGAWNTPPVEVMVAWDAMRAGFETIVARNPKVVRGGDRRGASQLGTLGSGNHFIEVCLDEADRVWVMLHSGSRGLGNSIGTYFISQARERALRENVHLPDKDLAWLDEGSDLFDAYWSAVTWAQQYARTNRNVMMDAVVEAMNSIGLPPFDRHLEAVNCHHNYVAKEHHFGADVFVTRKGAVRAGLGDMGIIPGSMGAKSFIVRGRGSADSFESCSHGAGRAMSRTQARKTFTVEDHLRATQGVECRKDADVIDETPAAYKPIDDVMAAQQDLVEVVHTLRQVLCVKG